MKLIDMLVEDGLNGWQWPDGVKCITQDNGSSIYKGVAFGYHKAPYLKKNIWLANNGTGHADAKIKKYDAVADDWATAIITREQYEAALAANNDGWIEWGGGECPVEEGALVDVKYRDGAIKKGLRALIPNSGRSASRLFWVKDNLPTDIIAYRLHQPQEAEQAEADDEADLNEYIGQDSAPVWSGEGLPPVGEKVIFFINPRFDYATQGMPAEGREIEVVAHKKTSDGNDVAVCYWDENDGGRAVCLVPESLMPAKSEADRKRDEAVKTIMLTGWCQAAAEEIYDLVAAGKVPGMKLED